MWEERERERERERARGTIDKWSGKIFNFCSMLYSDVCSIVVLVRNDVDLRRYMDSRFLAFFLSALKWKYSERKNYMQCKSTVEEKRQQLKLQGCCCYFWLIPS